MDKASSLSVCKSRRTSSIRSIRYLGGREVERGGRAGAHHPPMTMIVYPRETPPHTRTARAQPPAAHRRRHSRPHHRRHGEHSPTARRPHSNGHPASDDDDMLTPAGYPPTHSSRHGPQHTQHTASTAATPRYLQGRRLPLQTRRPHSNPCIRYTLFTTGIGLTRTNQSSVHSSGSPALPTLLHYYCTAIGQYTTSYPTPLVCHRAIQYWQ